MRALIACTLFAFALSGCASQAAFMPLDDWITKALIDIDGGVRAQTKFAYTGAGPSTNGGGNAGSVMLTVTGVFSTRLDGGAPAGFYVLLSGEVAAGDTRTVQIKLDPIAGATQSRALPGHTATVFECESGGFFDALFGNGAYHVLGSHQVPLVTTRDAR